MILLLYGFYDCDNTQYFDKSDEYLKSLYLAPTLTDVQ